MIVELRGIALYGYHGVLEEERLDGQRFLYDVELEVGSAACERTGSKTRSTTVTLGGDGVREVNDRQFQLLEALASAVADAIVERCAVPWVKVRVRKPEVRSGGPPGRA